MTDAFKNIDKLNVHDVTEMKSYPGMKKIQFIREFHPGIKGVEFHNRMKLRFK